MLKRTVDLVMYARKWNFTHKHSEIIIINDLYKYKIQVNFDRRYFFFGHEILINFKNLTRIIDAGRYVHCVSSKYLFEDGKIIFEISTPRPNVDVEHILKNLSPLLSILENEYDF